MRRDKSGNHQGKDGCLSQARNEYESGLTVALLLTVHRRVTLHRGCGSRLQAHTAAAFARAATI